MKIKLCMIGCGNITNTRHIPAVNKKNEAEIVGLISDQQEKVERTYHKYKKLKNVHTAIVNNNIPLEDQLKKHDWFSKDVDAVIVGIPPKQHFAMVEACLLLGKHVLVEKPMMMSKDECDRVIYLAKKNNLIINVMHSFQFAKGMENLNKIYTSGSLGNIKSILELQLSNRARRLPTWYNDLPLGLFYDEAAHFFYSANKFGGHLEVLNAHAVFNENDNTPRFLQAQLMAGKVPVQMYMNFNSPICEWGLMVVGDQKIAIYDFFKDILIVLKNDGQHYAKDVLKNSLSFTWQFWKGFIHNGFKIISRNLLYGHDVCISKFIDAIQTGEACYELSPELGREVVIAMNEVVVKAKKI